METISSYTKLIGFVAISSFLVSTHTLTFADPPSLNEQYLEPCWLSPYKLLYPTPELAEENLDNIPSGNYRHCRWGNLQDFTYGLVSPATLKFTRLTFGPFNEDNNDLFLTTSASINNPPSLERLSIPSDFTLWTAPDEETNSGGSINFPSGASVLFRKLHFPTSLEVGLKNYIAPNTEKLILLIHGWNPDSKSDSYEGEEMQALSQALTSATEGSGWSFVKYHWEIDSDTGGIDPSSAIYGTRAAEIARSHGLHLGSLLLRELPNLKKIHIICHSAGSWVGRETCRHLSLNSPKSITIDLSFLDPFIPSDVAFINSFLDKQCMNRIVNPGASWYDFGDKTAFYRLQNYYSDDLGDLSLGTSPVFDWNGRHINGARTHSEALRPEPNKGEYLWGNSYWNHSGPILFYADSIDSRNPSSVSSGNARSRLDHSTLRSVGWNQSMFWSEPLLLEGILEQPIFLLQGQQLAPIDVIISTRGIENDEDYFHDPFNNPSLRYRWYKQVDGEPIFIHNQGWITVNSRLQSIPFYKSVVSEDDDGVYGILVESTFNSANQYEYFDILNLSVQKTPLFPYGLVGWWEFDNSTFDISGHMNHGILYPGAPISYIEDRFGRTGRALLLDADAFIRVPDHSSIRVGDTATVSFWMKTKPLSNIENCKDFIPVLKRSESHQLLFAQIKELAGNRLKVELPYASGNIQGYSELPKSAAVIKSNKWNFIVITMDNGIVNLFINGRKEKTDTSSSGAFGDSVDNQPLFFGFGGDRNNENVFLPRAMDSIRLWNRPLSAEEILLLYKNDLPTDAFTAYPSNSDYAIWVSQHAQSSVLYLPLDDANNDGVANILEYAMTPIAGGDHDQNRPTTRILSDGKPCLDFSRRVNDEHLSLSVVCSPDLLNWTEVAKAIGKGDLLPTSNDVSIIETSISGGRKSSVILPNSNKMFMSIIANESSEN